MLGFVIIFGVAILFRIASWLFFTRIHEPPMEPASSQPFGFIDFVKETKSSNLARFIIFVALMNFTLNLAGPFQTVYLLENLKLDYVTYMLIFNASAVATLLTLGYWGRRADEHGNVSVIKSAAVLMPIAPILWIFSQNPAYLICAQVLAGFAWGGFNLCAPNFIYEASPKERRGRYLAYFSAINIAALSLGAFAGGFLGNILPPTRESRLLSLFVLAGVLRAAISSVFLPRLEEVRFPGKMRPPKLFYNTLSASPMVRGLFHNPLVYKPIVAEAQTYRPRSASSYSLFYNPFVKFVIDTAAEPKAEVPRRSWGLFHNREAAEKIKSSYESSEKVTEKASPPALFRYPSSKKQPRAARDADSSEAVRQPVSLFYNREMKERLQPKKGTEQKKEPSRVGLYYNRPVRKRPEQPAPKVRKVGLFYKPVPPDSMLEAKKKKKR
jgi:hypothetical protein